MSYLYQVLSQRVDTWRAAHYPCDDFPAIREILEFALEDGESGQLRYLRRAQLRALETYWYLRLVLNSPKIPDLYAQLFPSKKDRREAMGLTHPEIVSFIADTDFETCIERVKSDNAFVRQYALESLRESLTLDYPSYILALAMGAGKTILMGSIVATEFAMAMEYPDGPFVQNALIFAPGKTILSALRELSDVPYERLLPPRMHKPFAASLKLTFTRDGDKQIPIVWGSAFNVIVTNTEKIRIQKPNARGNGQQAPLFAGTKEEEATELANLRLQAVASLPHLAVFSDEAHHTYGQKLLGKWDKDKETGELIFKDDGIKKVRRTIDYLAEETNLVVVVNATGTPYFERQPLRDVVVWYGLGEGIRDGVLKELANNIKVFDLGDGEADTLVANVIDDFVRDYWGVTLPPTGGQAGAPARLALYFPNIETRDELRGAVESALARHGIGTDTLLAVDGKSSDAVRRQFEAVARNPEAPERVLLLVNMGTEGWNCPSLFATALVRKLANSNNFVLQAATRCLRQVPGNRQPARVYLTDSNRKTLESQLAETYGTSLKELGAQHADRVEREIRLHRPHLPPLLIRKRVLRYRRKADAAGAAPLTFVLPTVAAPKGVSVETLTPVQLASGTTALQKVDGGDDMLLQPTLDNRLQFVKEEPWIIGPRTGGRHAKRYPLGTAHEEARVTSDNVNRVSGYVAHWMKSWQQFHFHDTSDAAAVKRPHPSNDNLRLKTQADNLAAYLYHLRALAGQEAAYRRIVDTVKLAAPFFGGFVARDPVPETVELDVPLGARLPRPWSCDGSAGRFRKAAHPGSDAACRRGAPLRLRPCPVHPAHTVP